MYDLRGALSLRQEYELIRSQLVQERSTFIPAWRDLSDYILPRRARFFTSDNNKGDRRNLKIIDSTATLAVGTLRAGMVGGITSPARPWFRLTTVNTDLVKSAKVKDWLDTVADVIAATFLKSNIYNVLPIIYGDMGVFGTGAMLVEEDFDSVMRFYPFPIGSYMIGNDERLKVNLFFRDFRLTVRQLLARFGETDSSGKITNWENFTLQVKNLYDTGMLESWIEISHIIRPNPDFNPHKKGLNNKKYESCYYERGTSATGSMQASGDNNRYLSKKGYDYFPVLCPRWEITGEDVYGTSSPGMTAIGDIKQLQTGEKRLAQAIEKMINPAMTGPVSLKKYKASILPGDVTYVNGNEGAFRPSHEVNPQIMNLEQKQQQVRGRIQKALFEDLFLMLANSDRRQITAREIDERHEEKLLALGPVLEQLNQDMLDPLIDIAFDIHLRQGKLPPPPEELHGQPLKVDYVSVMAQAQKLAALGGIERFSQFSQGVLSVNPSSASKIDFDQMLDVYGDITSVPHGIIRSDEDTDKIRQQQAQSQQQQQQLEQINQASGVAKNLSQADTGGDNVLTRLMQQSSAGG